MLPTHLLFTDLETTGLDPTRDDIIEAGFILTTTDLTVITGLQCSSDRPGRRCTGSWPTTPCCGCTAPTGCSQRSACTTARAPDTYPADVVPVADAEQRVLDLLHDQDIRPGQVHIAGSGVAAFDKPFLAGHMPRLHAHLHYAPIDVGVLRRTWQMWTGADLVTANQDKTHRALDDARCHLAEATAFRQAFAAAAATMPIRR